MKNISSFLSLSALISIIFMSFTTRPVTHSEQNPMSLYDSIAAMDALWEDAYNNCKLDVMEEVISEDLEFYHDQGGLMTSKQKLNEALKTNICGKVKRALKQGSVEVYPIKGYGAVEMGLHGFYNSKEQVPQQLHYSKFVHIWKREHNKWRITRVISLH
ncbi:MAG TPA: nuclear transport factor 2 family protein [Chryseolinea sp.]